MKKTTKPETSAPAKGAAKLALETRRAAEAGMSLEAWMRKKGRTAAAAAPAPVKPPAKKGLISRILDRAHKPLSG